MKRDITFKLLMALLCFGAKSIRQTKAQAILFESGFETSISDEWASTISTGLSSFERINTEKHWGEYALKMSFGSASQKGNLNTNKTLNFVSGKTYLISFWAKGSVIPENTATNIKVHNGSGAKVKQYNFASWAHSTWKKKELLFNCTENINNGYLLFSFRPNKNGEGTFFIDDISVKEYVAPEPTFFDQLKTEKVRSDQSIKWVQFGPGMSGNNKAAFWHPTEKDILFIAPNMGNAYRSVDAGHTYETIFDEDESGYKDGFRGPQEFTDIEFSRQDPLFGFCTDERALGIFKTTNGGKTWVNDTKLHKTFRGVYVSTVTVDPKNDNTWYIGGGKIGDMGRILFPQSAEHGIHIDEGSQGKIWKSTDKGVTWTLKGNGIHSKAEVQSMLVDPKNTSTIYAATNYGFFKSTDAGETWQLKIEGLGNDVLRSFDYHYDKDTDKLSMYLINSVMWGRGNNTVVDSLGGIFKSTDRGETWQCINGDIALDMTPFQSNSAIKKSFYHAVGYYFGMSDAEAQATFPNLPTSITQRFNQITVDPNDPNNLYAVNMYSNASRNNFQPGQMWRSKDGGKHWYVCFRNGKNWNTGNDVAYWQARNNPTGSNVSINYLHHWVNRDAYDRKSCNFTRFNADGSILHAQMAKISLMSYDKGETWVDIDDVEIGEGTENFVGAGNSNVPGHGFFQHKDLPGTVFCAAGENSLWITNEEGNTVRKGAQAASARKIYPDEQSLSCYAIHPNNTNIHYALFFRQAGRGNIAISRDNGENWEELGTPIPAWDLEAHSGDQSVHQLNLIIDPLDPNNMYFCVPKQSRNLEFVGNSTTAFGIHKSSDGGVTWSEANTGLPNTKDVTTICFDPKNSATLYAAVQNANGGLFRSTNRGETWEEAESTKNISLTKGINDVHFAEDGTFYITAGTKNGAANEGGVWKSTDDGQTWTHIFDYPWTYRIESAMYDSNILLISTLPNTTVGMKNAGTYLSKDGGETWKKINKGNGQSDRVNDIAINNTIPGRYYASTYGSGWYMAQDPELEENKAVEGISLNAESLEININETKTGTYTITPVDASNKEVIWSSNNESIAIVNQKGEVLGIAEGTTTITVTTTDSSFTDQIEITVLGIPTDVKFENVASEINIFPNPNSGYATIETNWNTSSTGRLEIFNMKGEKVKSVKLKNISNNNKISVSLSHLPTGTYILKLIDGEKVAQSKVIRK